MLTHDEMVGLQAEKHDLIQAREFSSKEAFVLHLMHASAYMEAAKLAVGKNVLDLGCNTGYGTEILARLARRAVGVDVSQEAVAVARQLYGNEGIEFQLIDGKGLPFADGEFDVVISCQVVEHIVDYDIYFGEIKRVLSPEGIAIFTTPNAVLRLDRGMKPWNPFHVREFESAELQSLLEGYFSGVEIRGLFAIDELYKIEKHRVEAARDAARLASEAGRHGHEFRIRSIVKKILPDGALSMVRGALNSRSKDRDEFNEGFIKRFGVGDFFYRPDGLVDALDFQAICRMPRATPDCSSIE
jgi:SAM-dependent methyltransferase